MSSRSAFLLLAAGLLALPGAVLAEPRPGFVAGTFEESATVVVFGTDFGAPPGEQGPAVDNSPPVSCVLIGDAPTLAACGWHEAATVETWLPGKIRFRISENHLAEQVPFYFFIVDADGQTSWGVGPWMVGMGILESTGRTIALEGNGQVWNPEGGFPVVTGSRLERPGQPTNMSLGQ